MAVDRTRAQPRALTQVSLSIEGPKGADEPLAGAGVERQPSHGKIDSRVPGTDIAEIDYACQ